jgi:hypothetical protein
MRAILALVFSSVAFSVATQAEILSIENNRLAASYDSQSHRFSVREPHSLKAVIPQGQLLDGPLAKASVEPVRDAVFGRGRQIRVTYENGSVSALELYSDLPFLLIRTKLRNATGGETDLRSIVPARFTVDLGYPVADLRTLGTAGLTAPEKNPGSYLFLTLAHPATRRSVVAGWLTQDRGSGVWFSSLQLGQVAFQGRVDYWHLRVAPGASADLETLVVGAFDDGRLGQELYADAVARQYRIQLHPQINGYCTWYSNPHGGAADETSIVQLADVAARELKPFGFSFIQIDDKWQDGQERNGPARRFYRVKPDGPYPHGIAPVARRLKSLGLMTGLWFLPFASDWKDPEFSARQHWFMKRQDGAPFETDWGNTSLDLTQPEVRGYLSDLVKTVRSWGVEYFKMDGLWTGTATKQIYVNDGFHDDEMGENAPFHDPKVTNVEAMRSGLKLLRQAAGPDVFFSGCNLSQNMRSLAGSIGLVDSMRIGPDNGQAWRDYRQEIAENASGSIITGPVRGTRLYFLHGRFWWNDPDPCYVRASIPLHHARLITSWVGLSGQFNLNSDWIPGLSPERLDVLKRTMPAHGAVARPVDYFDHVLPGVWLVTDTRQSVRRDVLGLFNWESTNAVLGCACSWAGLDPAGTYYAFDFWDNRPAGFLSHTLSFDVPGQSCRVIALRRAEGHPVLVSTSRHVSQGMVDVTEEKWARSSKVLRGMSRVVGQDAYELRIAGLNEGKSRWKLVSAAVSAEDQAAGVRIAPQPTRPNEEGWVRVDLRSATSRQVNWRLQFSKDKW